MEGEQLGITMHLLYSDKHREPGFTLVELMIAMVISSIIVAAIYSAYKMQRDVFEAQDQITEVQQNIRAATWAIVREIRMAGFDPTESAGAGITVATAGRIGFTQDITDNSGTGSSDEDTDDANENITFGFSAADDADNNGIPDAGTAISLGRDTGGGYQAIADNIQAVEFYYTLEDGTSILPTAAAPITAAQLTDIRSIQVSILARTRYPDREYTDGLTYLPASNTAAGTVWGPYNDHFRRRLLTTTVTCRNLGL